MKNRNGNARMSIPSSQVELPEELLEQIRVRLEARIGELEKYDIPQNSGDHLLLVAIPLARDEIESVVLADDVFESIVPWLNTGETRQHTPHSRNSRIEELARYLGIEMVRHYRPNHPFTRNHCGPNQTITDRCC